MSKKYNNLSQNAVELTDTIAENGKYSNKVQVLQPTVLEQVTFFDYITSSLSAKGMIFKPRHTSTLKTKIKNK